MLRAAWDGDVPSSIQPEPRDGEQRLNARQCWPTSRAPAAVSHHKNHRTRRKQRVMLSAVVFGIPRGTASRLASKVLRPAQDDYAYSPHGVRSR